MTTRELTCKPSLTIPDDGGDPVLELGRLQIAITPAQALELLIHEGTDNAVRQSAELLSVVKPSLGGFPFKTVTRKPVVHSQGASLKARYAKRLADGVCVWDDKKVLPGTRYCREHNRKLASRGRK